MITDRQQKQIDLVSKGLSMAFWRWPGLIRALAKERSETNRKMVKLVEWIQATHRLGPPNRIKKLLSKPVVLFLLSASAAAQPAPLLRNAFTTNSAGNPVLGQDNLSLTNVGSGTNWQFFNVGPRTVARLSDVTNIASAFTGDAGGTNSRQGGSLVLTNLSNNPIPFTNIIAASTGIALGTNSGITYITNTIDTTGFQPASANLTNWSNIPTGAMANVVSTTFLTNWANAISNYVTASTNSALVTNWITTRQPASENLTNWSNIPTGSMANIPAVTFLTNWANSISNLTQTKQHGTESLTNISGNPNVATNISGAGTITVTSNNLGGWTVTGSADTGPTNGNQFLGVPLSIKSGAFTTNLNAWGSGTNYGTFLANSNLLVRSGQSTSNAWVGGVIYLDLTANRTNLNATVTTFTNLSTNTIPAHTLTNNGDAVVAEWSGKMANAAVNTNNFRILLGSQTVLDTGLQISSNCPWNAQVKIIRTGNTEQLVIGHFEWGPNGGIPWVYTNVNIVTSQTNGISTYIALQSSARRVGAHTNNYFRLKYESAPN